MIHLEKNSTKDISVTLKEKQTLDSPFFLFEFIHEATETNYTVILDDVSSYTYRSNEFSCTLPTDVDIQEEGDFIYNIYEQEDNVNLDVDNTTSLLETGKMRVKTEDTSEHFYTPN